MSQIPEFEGGVPSFREKLNRMRQLVNALWNMKGDDEGIIRVIRNQSGVTVSLDINKLLPRIPKTQPSTNDVGQDLAVQSVHEDYLTCRTWDSIGLILGTTDIYVAKPPLLRKTPIHGKTINGLTFNVTSSTAMATTKVSDSSVENHLITPFYMLPDPTTLPAFPGEIIHVISGITGLNGPDSKLLILIDTNQGGHAWRKVTS